MTLEQRGLDYWIFLIVIFSQKFFKNSLKIKVED